MKNSSFFLIALLLSIILPVGISNTVQAADTEYSLTVNIFGSGSVSVNGSSPYDAGVTVQLTANPAAGWTFSGWSGDLGGSVNPEYLFMNSNKTVFATFTEIPEYSLSVNIIGSGIVAVNGSSPYEAGSVVQLTAYPSDGWEFTQWNGDVLGTANPELLLMDSNKSVTCTFTEGVRDVEAVSQTVTDNEVEPGDLVDIDVTIRNNGDFVETFDLTCYYDSVDVGTVRVIDLAPGESRVVIFTLDTAGVPVNEYDIKALADSSNEIIEVNEDNNWCNMPLRLFVVPEVPLGTILAVLSMFVALICYVVYKRSRNK